MNANTTNNVRTGTQFINESNNTLKVVTVTNTYYSDKYNSLVVETTMSLFGVQTGVNLSHSSHRDLVSDLMDVLRRENMNEVNGTL